MRIFSLSHTETQPPTPLAKSTQSVTKSEPENAFSHRTPESTRPRTSEDSVSTLFTFLILIVDDPSLQPRKDYDDYTRFINDTYAEEKEDMLNQTVSNLNKTGGFENMQKHNPIMTLRTYSEKPKLFMNKRNLKLRNFSVSGPMNETEKKLGQTLNNFDVKPKLLESKIRCNTDFFNISDGFKKVFAHGDRKD